MIKMVNLKNLYNDFPRSKLVRTGLALTIAGSLLLPTSCAKYDSTPEDTSTPPPITYVTEPTNESSVEAILYGKDGIEKTFGIKVGNTEEDRDIYIKLLTIPEARLFYESLEELPRINGKIPRIDEKDLVFYIRRGWEEDVIGHYNTLGEKHCITMDLPCNWDPSAPLSYGNTIVWKEPYPRIWETNEDLFSWTLFHEYGAPIFYSFGFPSKDHVLAKTFAKLAGWEWNESYKRWINPDLGITNKDHNVYLEVPEEHKKITKLFTEARRATSQLPRIDEAWMEGWAASLYDPDLLSTVNQDLIPYYENIQKGVEGDFSAWKKSVTNDPHILFK